MSTILSDIHCHQTGETNKKNTFMTYKLSEEIQLNEAQQTVDDDACPRHVRPHVDVRQSTDVEVGSLHALDDGRREPVRHEEQEEPRRVPHLDTVVVDHRQHRANHVGNVRDVKVEMKSTQ